MHTITGSRGSYRFDFKDRLNDERGAMSAALFTGVSLDDRPRPVAIKLLSERTVNNPVNLARTKAIVEAAVRHENVVELIDFCEEEDIHGDKFYFVVMEMLEGENVADRFNRYFKDHQKPYPEDTVLHLSRQVLAGLKAIHDKGIVHRDVDPSNWMVCTPDEGLKIIDLDIAYLPRATYGTNRGTRLGKLSYMPPQQIDGLETPKPDWDLYALGISMYQLLTGELPYSVGEEAPMIHAIRNKPLPKHEHLSPRMFSVLQKATAKLSENRFQSADEFLAALEPPKKRPSPVAVFRAALQQVGTIAWPLAALKTVFTWAGSTLVIALVVWGAMKVLQRCEFPTETPAPPPVAVIEVINNACEAPCAVTLRSVSENTDEQTAFSWTDENGVVLSTETVYRYEETGMAQITLTVKNADGQSDSETRQVEIRRASPPVADFTLNTSGCEAPCTVSASANATGEPSGTVYKWTGGVTTQEGRETQFSFKQPGKYRITLTVTRADGASASESREVEVTKKVVEPSPTLTSPKTETTEQKPPCQSPVLEQAVINRINQIGTYIKAVPINSGSKKGLRIYYRDKQNIERTYDAIDEDNNCRIGTQEAPDF